jgi:hypothetical protein
MIKATFGLEIIMKKNSDKKEIEYENLVTLVIGIWVMIAPLFLGIIPSYPGANVYIWNFFFVGLTVIVMSVLATRKMVVWAETINFMAGVWLILSPLFLVYYNLSEFYFWNSIIAGLFVSIFSAMSIPLLDKIVYHKHKRSPVKENDHYLIMNHQK